jgi:hypothetical protein
MIRTGGRKPRGGTTSAVAAALILTAAVWPVAGRAGTPPGGRPVTNMLLGQDLAAVLASDFTRFFRFTEQQRGPSGGGTLVLFTTGAQGYGAQVGWLIDPSGRVRGAMLALRRVYLEDPANGVFARDLAASFLRAAGAAEDGKVLGVVADEILYARRRFKVVQNKTTLDGQAVGEQKFLVPEGEEPRAGGSMLTYPGYLPVPPPTPSGAFLAYGGKQESSQATYGRTVVELANREQKTPAGTEQVLFIRVSERTP